MAYSITVHDSLPDDEARIVDAGLGEANALAAPLHEVVPLSCFARDPGGKVIGGAVGRRWGEFCELRQLWVTPEHRREGIGRELIRVFESSAVSHGCTSFYLETYSFQAPGLYLRLGYTIAHEHKRYPYGIVRYLMVKSLGEPSRTA